MEKLRKAMNEIAYAQDHAKLSPLQRSFVPVLSFASTLYKLALSLRRSLYHLGLFREHRYYSPPPKSNINFYFLFRLNSQRKKENF